MSVHARIRQPPSHAEALPQSIRTSATLLPGDGFEWKK